MTSKRILAFSSSHYVNDGYLEAAAPVIKKFHDSKSTNIAFIPFASVEKITMVCGPYKSGINCVGIE